MPDDSQKQFEQEQAHGREVLSQQREEIDEAKTKAEQERRAAEEQENLEWEEAEWSTRLAAAKGVDRGGGPGNGSRIEDNPRLKKEADAISKEIREEKKKTGTDYMLTYVFLTVLGGTLDILGVIFDLLFFLAWINLILGPTYAVIRYLGVKYANIGISSKEHDRMNLLITLISGAVASAGVPSRAASMIMEFTARKKIADDANKKIAELQKKRDKLLGPELAKQYMPPR